MISSIVVEGGRHLGYGLDSDSGVSGPFPTDVSGPGVSGIPKGRTVPLGRSPRRPWRRASESHTRRCPWCLVSSRTGRCSGRHTRSK